MIKNNKDVVFCIILFVLSVWIYSQGLNIHGLEYRDDEIFYFKSTQEMLATSNYFSPTYFGEDRFQKPILFYWFILTAYQLFGVDWFAARIVSVVFAGLTVAVTWLLAKRLFNQKVAWLSAFILMNTPLFFRHAKNAVPDMALNFFVVWAFYFLFLYIENPKARRNQAGLFVACALGFMVKGFAALLFPLGTLLIYALLSKRYDLLKQMRWGWGFSIFTLIVAPWFVWMVVIHGDKYVDYMLVEETKNRLVSAKGKNTFLVKLASVAKHVLFYMKVLFSKFLPWSVFLVAALPAAFLKMRRYPQERKVFQLLLIWFFFVVVFFSCMYFTISHYLLVLSTPFAVLVSYFLLESFNAKKIAGKTIIFLRENSIVLFLVLSALAYCFLWVFLAKQNPWWGILFIFILMASVYAIKTTKDLIVAPMILCVFMLFLNSQSVFMAKIGLTPHSILQRFAQTVQKDPTEKVLLVGSHGLHEKEFQVYFKEQVYKVPNDNYGQVHQMLEEFFAKDEKVYCLIKDVDFQKHFADAQDQFDIVQEEYSVRRRMRIDKGFFAALFKVDQDKVYDYFMEKILLITKENNG